jgi:CspA family cold shock protein
MIMKTGTVRWFNPEKGYGFIHPDDGSPNVSVRRSAIESAGVTGLEPGQRIHFQIQQNERTGDMSAESLQTLAPVTTPSFERGVPVANPFDVISAFIQSVLPLSLR